MGSYDDRYKRIREAYLGNAESKKTQTMSQSALPGSYGSKYEYIRDRYVVNRETYKKAEEEKKATAERESRQQMQKELAQLRKSYTPGGAFGGRTQEDKDTLHRIQYLEGQLSRMESDDYYQTALKRLGELDEETIGYLDQLRESSTPKATVEMQGIADNRSWEEIYAERYQMDENVKKALLDKGYTEEQIAQYVKDRTRQVNRENYEAEVAKSRAESDNGVMGAVIASAKSVPQNLTGGLGYLSLASQRAHNALRGYDEPLDYYTPEMVGQAKAQAARQTVSQKLEENTELSTALTGNVASFLYNTGMSMADSAAIATMTAVGVPPSVGTAFLGGTAATQATVAAKERGVSDDRALLTGLAAGAAEAFFEKVSLDKLLSASPTEGLLHQRVMQGLKNMGIQGTVEGTEELATSLANAITDSLINGGQSEYNQNVQRYMADGKSAEEAGRLATKDFVLSLGADFLGGFISGGVMSIGADSVRNRAYKSAYGENAQELTDEALEIDPENKTALYAKKRLEEGKSVSGAILRSLVSQNQRKIDADSASAAETAEETGEATQDTTEVSDGTEAKRTAVSPISHNTEFTEEEARYIVEEGAKEFGNAASSVVNSYMRGQDPQMYMAQAKLVFNYGKTMSEEKGLPYALNSPLLKSMDETQIRSLFNAGRMQAKSIPVSAVKGTGKAVLGDGLDYSLLSPVQKTQVNALAAFAKASGYTIELFESKANAEGNYTAEQGSFNTKTGVIRIDINAGRDKVTDLTNYAMVRVASHEITHSFKKNAPQQYVALRDYVTGVLADKGKFDDLVDAKMRDLGIDHETAVDEVVADGCEMMLRDTRFINNLAKENRTLFEKIRDAIRKFVKKIRDAFEGVEIAHEEAQLLKDAENLQKLWDEALAKSVENVAAAEETTTESVGEVKKSMRAATKEDPVAEAERMEKGGATRDEIFKATGLIRDASGCWVAEMDDSQMKIFPKGDALLANNPEYQRYMELAREGDFFSAEFQELAKKFKKSGGKKTLEQFVQYDELFRRFPEMRNVEFLFRDLGGSSRGYWSAAANAIVLDESLKKGVNQNELSRVAIHEIQHALQHFEKRATGSSVEYWEEKKAQGYKRGKNDKKIKDADAAYRKLFDAAPEDVKRVVREINRAYLAKDYDRAAELADGMAGTEHEDVFWAIDEADFTRRMLRDSNEELTARELYLDTAGEIEARTTAARVGMSAEQRREKAPDLGWDRAVFADNSGDVMYSKRDSEYMIAVESGDMEAAQRMVDEAARAAGYTIEAYHGTNAEFFTFDKGRVGKGQDVYGSGFYFASERDAAEAYGKRIISSRLKLENPYRVIVRPTSGGLRDIKLTQKQVYEILKRHPKIRAEDSPLGDFYEEFWEQGAKDWMIRGLARQYTDLQTLEGDLFRDYPNELHEAIRDVTGHDGIEVRFQRDETGFSPDDGGTFYVAWFDNQMKSAEPVVRDDAGEVIPLSQRFDESQSDIRYSKRDYSYAALTSKPDMTVTAVREETQYDRKTVVENALKSAASVGRRTENGNAVIKVRDIGKDVVVTKRSLVHGLDRRLNVQAPVLENVGSVLQNAIRINELTPRRDDAESTYVLVGAARGTKGMYIASFVVNSITDEVTTVDVLYALNAKKESAALLPKFTDESATPTDSVISVANLLDYVNQYFPDILPEDVLKHYGHDERPAGKLGADALFSFRTGYIPTDRSILASYAPKDGDSDMVKRHIAEYQKNVEELRKLEQTLREQREQMRGLAGDENKMRRAMLRDEIIKTQNRIQIASDQLLRKEKWMGVRTVLNREKDALVKQARAEEREKLTKYREQRWDTESRRKLRERITYRVKTLDKMLRNPTDDKHIPDGLQSAILDFCEAFTENTTVFPKKRLDSIRAEYAALESKVSETSLADLYDESIKEMLEYLGEVMSGKRLSELNVEQLNMVKAIADHFAFMVKNENEIFVQGRKVKLDETAQGVIFDAKGSGKDAMHLSESQKAFKQFMTSGNMKPIYRFRNMGDGIKGLFQSLLDAEYEYGKRMRLSERFVAETKQDTGYGEWSNTDKVLEFTNAAGQRVTLTLQQAMSLLATYEREIRHPNGLKHVTAGGFVYEKNVTATKKVAGVSVKVDVQSEAGKAHPMSVEDMDKVRSWLGEVDPRVLDYMEKMVEYLSTTMSEYGNETSMQLHGYKKFGEGYYFPIKSAEEFLQQEPGKAGFDESRWKHKGFTKATVKGALNPFVLRDFDDVWGNHVSQMLMYSTMAVPQDAFVRVMNYKTQVDPTGSTESVSVKSAIKSGYGNDALSYIDTLLSDVNGGVVGDPRGTPLDRFVSMYKKNAVSLSASVVVQQYSAVVRAMSLIKSKYFRKTMNPVEMFKAFERAKEHSGVAVIKEIGGFDTSMGRSGADWLMEETPVGLKNKGKALVQFGEKDTGYRDRVIGALPAIADKVGWGHIWIAAENEIADTTDLERGADAFYEAVAKRFEEVIELTQVYDSVLTRSENMRSKHALVKAVTSFMGEPTVVLNMVASAIADVKAGKEGAKEKLGAVIGAVFFSIILNNFLKAFATAPRDKDEDQTIAEKWLEDFVGGTANDLFFANYLPVARDVVSAWSGYSVDATWFAPFEGLTNGVKGLLKDGEWHWDAAPDFINGVSAFYGLPVKNITRDLAGFYNIFAKSASLDETSARGFWNAFRNGMGWMPGVDDAMEKALNADRRGNDAQRKKALEELAKLYEDKAKQFRLEGKEDAAKKAKSSLKSSITAYLKPLYQAAKTQAEKNRIKSLALRVYVGGQQLYSGYDFERYWGEE